MDKLNSHRQRRLEALLKLAGWNPHAEGITSNPTRFWLYSVSLEHGPRMISAIGAGYLREMVSKTGQVATLLKEFPEYWKALAEAIALFDEATGKGKQTEELRQVLSLFAGFYACNTQTWNIVKPLNQVPGTHFIILDWIGQDGGRIMRPAHIHRADPLSEAELSDFSGILIKMHLAKRPEDMPRSFN